MTRSLIAIGFAVAALVTPARPAAATADTPRHHEERPRCWDDDCDDRDGDGYSGGDYGHNRRDDRNRNRGAFSPGPFDRSPVDFSNSCISLDCSGREKRRDDSEQPGPSDP